MHRERPAVAQQAVALLARQVQVPVRPAILERALGPERATVARRAALMVDGPRAIAGFKVAGGHRAPAPQGPERETPEAAPAMGAAVKVEAIAELRMQAQLAKRGAAR